MRNNLALAAAVTLVAALGILWVTRGHRGAAQKHAPAVSQAASAHSAPAQPAPLPPLPEDVEPVVVANFESLPPPAPVAVELPEDLVQALEHIRLEAELRRDVPVMPYADDFEAPRMRMPYADEEETLPMPRVLNSLEIDIDVSSMVEWSAVLLPAICWKEAGETLARTIAAWLDAEPLTESTETSSIPPKALP
ncbi:MAG: hypothetical protein L0Y72_16135 [Gemmataceae bacterium]|nr:hypothetical protein [Gemmataceae bacterium]MCI0740577.1 hypothetical protein [Gemmataceae bacterium]